METNKRTHLKETISIHHKQEDPHVSVYGSPQQGVRYYVAWVMVVYEVAPTLVLMAVSNEEIQIFLTRVMSM